MRESDFAKFAAMLDDVWALKQQTLTGSQKAMFTKALASHSLAEVRAGLDAHVKDPIRGRFLPMPADIIAQIEGIVADDGRPGPDEAWAIATRAVDESETVVWTAEIESAWGACRQLYETDEIGARMAFRDTYNRLLEAARTARTRAVWNASIGFDAGRRQIAVEDAVRLGRFTSDTAALIAGPNEGPVLQLGDLMRSPDIPPAAREAIERFKQRVAQKSTEPGIDFAEKVRTDQLRAESAARVEAYRRGEPA